MSVFVDGRRAMVGVALRVSAVREDSGVRRRFDNSRFRRQTLVGLAWLRVDLNEAYEGEVMPLLKQTVRLPSGVFPAQFQRRTRLAVCLAFPKTV